MSSSLLEALSVVLCSCAITVSICSEKDADAKVMNSTIFLLMDDSRVGPSDSINSVLFDSSIKGHSTLCISPINDFISWQEVFLGFVLLSCGWRPFRFYL